MVREIYEFFVVVFRMLRNERLEEKRDERGRKKGASESESETDEGARVCGVCVRALYGLYPSAERSKRPFPWRTKYAL